MRMPTSIAILTGSALTVAIIQPWQQPEPIIETVVETQTVIEEVATTIDIDRLRQVPASSNIDKQLDLECTYAIQRLTDEPLMGIILYTDEYWNGDACQAYEHQVLHGWY